MSQEEKSTQTAISKKCPLGKCDGGGLIYVPEYDAYKKCECMKLAWQNRLLSFANIPKEFQELKVGDFDTEMYDDECITAAKGAKAAAVGFVKNFSKIREMGRGLYFYSEMPGSGKTRLMASVGNAIVKMQSVSVRFITAANLFDKIKSTFNSEGNEYEEMLKELKEIDVLLIDDVGAEMPTEWTASMFCSILNDRLTQSKITVFTSNYSVSALPYDERIRSRISKMAVPIHFPEQSIRDKITQMQNEEFIRMLTEG